MHVEFMDRELRKVNAAKIQPWIKICFLVKYLILAYHDHTIYYQQFFQNNFTEWS